MASEDYIIVSIVEKALGKPKSDKDPEERVQWEFNCPTKTCRENDEYDKHNLAYNSEKKIFKCWSCKYSGHVSKLIRDYGSQDDLKKLKFILPAYKSTTRVNVFRKSEIDYNQITCKLPDGYLPLGKNYNTKFFKIAWDYLTNVRKIDQKIIDKFQIGYTETGSRKYRIIIPSYNSIGKLNYFEARSYFKKTRMPYFKPEEPHKDDIIFNEANINWDLPVYLVEGVFDMFRIENSIPMLGKKPSPYLISKLLEHRSRIILCLDEDAFKDGIDIYNQLTSLGLDVYFVDLSGKGDVSYIYENHGNKAVVELLKTAKRINFEDQINILLKK